MIFSKMARLLAVLVFMVAVGQLWIGFSDNQWVVHDLSRYSWIAPPGAVIDRGIYMILFAAALGTLAEIGIALGKARNTQ